MNITAKPKYDMHFNFSEKAMQILKRNQKRLNKGRYKGRRKSDKEISMKITAEHLFELGDEQMSIKDSNKNKSQLNCYNCRKAKNILDLIDVDIEKSKYFINNVDKSLKYRTLNKDFPEFYKKMEQDGKMNLQKETEKHKIKHKGKIEALLKLKQQIRQLLNLPNFD